MLNEHTSNKFEEKSSKSTIVTGLITGALLFLGIDPAVAVVGSTSLVTLLPDSWFD